MSDVNKCSTCFPGYELSTDSTGVCNLMDIPNCWTKPESSSLGVNGNYTLSVQNLFDKKATNGLYHFFETTKLESIDLDSHYGYGGLKDSAVPCLACGPTYVPSVDGFTCEKL